MEIVSVPLGDKFILYRPLLRLAFVGNEAMARLVMRLSDPQPGSVSDLPPAISDYLAGIGFLEPDPPPPSLPDSTYRPTHAVLLVTNRCNLRCIYCYASAGERAAQEVSIELARIAIDHVHHNAQELGRSQFALTFHGGGEPLLAWKTLQETVAYTRAKELPCRISVVSNGLWTKQQADWILHNLDALTISFDGTRETQDHQRPRPSGGGTFEAVLETVRLLDQHQFDYGIRMTALPPWQGRLAQDVGWLCQETGCARIQVEPAFNQARGEYQPPSPAEAVDFATGFMEAFEVAERAGRRLHFSGARPWLLTSVFCTAPYGALIVRPDGDLVTCYEITDSGHPLDGLCTIGRIAGSDVLVDPGKRQMILSRLEARRESCRDCFCYWHCAGDCHAKALHPASGSTAIDTRCQMNRDIVAQMLLWYTAASEDGVYRGLTLAEQDPGE
jgi:uncharacterized protein